VTRPLWRRVAAVAPSLGVSAAFLGWTFEADTLALTPEQDFFVGDVLTYSVTALCLLQQDALRRRHVLTKKTPAVIVVDSPLAVFLVLFQSGALPRPTSMGLYVVGPVLIAPPS
jgi:hypothetical protein